MTTIALCTLCRRAKKDHNTLLHTKYESSGPYGFRLEDFFCIYPGAGPVWTPGAGFAGFYKEELKTLLHTKYKSSWPCGFGEEDFFMFFP